MDVLLACPQFMSRSLHQQLILRIKIEKRAGKLALAASMCEEMEPVLAQGLMRGALKLLRAYLGWIAGWRMQRGSITRA